MKSKNSKIIWLPQGRLGNLIFQYQAFNSIVQAHNAVPYAFRSELNTLFQTNKNIHWINLQMRGGARLLLWLCQILRYIAKAGLIGIITPYVEPLAGNYEFETKRIRINTGFLKNIYILEGWFQYNDFLHPLPTLKKEHLIVASKHLAAIPVENRVALHCRLGDYSDWEVMGKKGVNLPMDFYLNAISKIKSKLPGAVFIIFSDDTDLAEKYFSNHNCIFYTGSSVVDDFAGIASCSHAIISASTFSWWAAQLITNPNKLIIAPKFWAGFKSGVWYPRDIRVENFIYLEVT